MILSSYERKDSPFVWLQWSTGRGAKRVLQKTKIRKDDPKKEAKIGRMLELKKAALQEIAPDTDATGLESWRWVEPFLKSRFAPGSRTREVYGFQWRVLHAFLIENEIAGPCHVTRELCAVDYVEWRTSQIKEKSKKNPSVNTAIGELKLLAQIMDEAIARKMATANPARKLKIGRAEVKEKPEITDDEARAIYAALPSQPAWMQRSFHIALQTGLRFSETRIQRSQVNLRDGLLQIEAPKGGRGKAFSIPIYPGIREMVRAFWESGEPELWTMKPNERDFASLVWGKLFKKLGLAHLCFHCTRVTFISRGARAGIPEGAMMAMVNHGSTDIHRVYRRFLGADALRYVDRMQLPAPPSIAAKE